MAGGAALVAAWAMSVHYFRFARVLAMLLVLLGLGTGARAQLLPSQAAGPARSQVVMLEVGGTVGAGVVVGSDANAIYVATAAHIADLAKHPRPKVNVRFDDAPGAPRAGEFMAPFETPEDGDLAVVTVKLDEGLRAFLNGLDFAMLSPAPLPPVDAPVTSIGYSGGSAWTRGRNETLLPNQGETIRITSEVVEGQSGGAVYNEAWELIGLAQYRDPAGPIVYVRPIGSVLKALRAWGVPVRLTVRPEAARMKGADEVARENERRAQRALRRNLAARLAAQSDQVRQASPVRSILLAAEALRATQQDGIVTNVAREALSKSVGGMAGVGLNGHAETVFSAAFNGGESMLATASRDGVIRVWDIANPRTPRCIKVLKEPGQGDYLIGHVMSFDKQSKSLITLATSGRTSARSEHLASPKIWPLDTAEISPAPRWLLDSRAAAKAMAASHSREQLAVATADGGVLLYATASRPGRIQRRLSVPPGVEIRHLVFARDGKVLFGSTEDARVVIWNLRSAGAAPSAAFDTGHRNRGPFTNDNLPMIDRIDISDDHTMLVTASSIWRIEGGFGDPTLRVWRLNDYAPVGLPWVIDQSGNESNKFVLDAFFLDKSHLLAAVTPGGARRVWDPAKGRFDGAEDAQAIPNRAASRELFSGAAHARDRHLLALSHGESLDVLRTDPLRDGAADQMVRLSSGDDHVEVIAFSDSARYLFAGSNDGGARLWDMKRADPLGPPSSLEVNPYSNAAAVSLSDSGRIAVTLRGQSLEFWNIGALDDPRLLHAQDIDLKQFGDCVVCHLQLSPDERWAVIQAPEKNRSLLVEIGAAPAARRIVSLAARTWTPTRGMSFSPDSSLLVVDEDDGPIVFYDLRAKSPSRTLVVDGGSYYTPDFSPDGKWLVFRRHINEYHDPIGRDRIVGFVAPAHALQDMRQRLPISGFATEMARAVFSPDGQWLSLSGASSYPERQNDDRRVQLLRLVDQQWTKHADLEAIEFAAALLHFSADGRWLLTGSNDVTIADRNVSARIWDLQRPLSGAQAQTLPNTIWNLKLAKFSPDSRWLVTVSGANPHADLWMVKDGKWEFVSRLTGPLPRLNNHWSAVYSPDSKALVLWTTDDATPFYWRLDGQQIAESGKAIPNGDWGIYDVKMSSNGQALTILNSGREFTQLYGKVDSYVTYVDLAAFPAEDAHFFVPASANAKAHVYRHDLGVVLTAGTSVSASVVNMEMAMRRSADIAGRNMKWDEWVKSGIASPYRPTFSSASVGPDVVQNLTREFARLVELERLSEAALLKQDLVTWASRISDPDACNRLAWELATTGDPAAALDMINKSLRLAPENPNYRDTRGVALALLQRNKEAIADFEYFVKMAQDIDRFKNLIPARLRWIKQLRAGRNPFS